MGVETAAPWTAGEGVANSRGQSIPPGHLPGKGATGPAGGGGDLRPGRERAPPKLLTPSRAHGPRIGPPGSPLRGARPPTWGGRWPAAEDRGLGSREARPAGHQGFGRRLCVIAPNWPALDFIPHPQPRPRPPGTRRKPPPAPPSLHQPPPSIYIRATSLATGQQRRGDCASPPVGTAARRDLCLHTRHPGTPVVLRQAALRTHSTPISSSRSHWPALREGEGHNPDEER